MLNGLNAGEIAGVTVSPGQLDAEAEANLRAEISMLWSAHKAGKVAAKRTKEELKALRRNLGERLYAMKALLAHAGRGGHWASYLREHRLPRATADRYVRAHEATLNPKSTNRASEAISEPTEAEVKKFFHRLLPRLDGVITTQQAVYWFGCEMLMELRAADGMLTDDGVLLLKPVQTAPPSAS